MSGRVLNPILFCVTFLLFPCQGKKRIKTKKKTKKKKTDFMINERRSFKQKLKNKYKKVAVLFCFCFSFL